VRVRSTSYSLRHADTSCVLRTITTSFCVTRCATEEFQYRTTQIQATKWALAHAKELVRAAPCSQKHARGNRSQHAQTLLL